MTRAIKHQRFHGGALNQLLVYSNLKLAAFDVWPAMDPHQPWQYSKSAWVPCCVGYGDNVLLTSLASVMSASELGAECFRRTNVAGDALWNSPCDGLVRMCWTFTEYNAEASDTPVSYMQTVGSAVASSWEVNAA